MAGINLAAMQGMRKSPADIFAAKANSMKPPTAPTSPMESLSSGGMNDYSRYVPELENMSHEALVQMVLDVAGAYMAPDEVEAMITDFSEQFPKEEPPPTEPGMEFEDMNTDQLASQQGMSTPEGAEIEIEGPKKMKRNQKSKAESGGVMEA